MLDIPLMYAGIQIIESPYLRPLPVLQLSPTFEWCTEKGRAEMNAWLLERFGTREQAVFLPDGRLAVTPGVAQEIRKATLSGLALWT